LVGIELETDRTIVIKAGMQNGRLASGNTVQMGKIATVGLAPAVNGPS
jgi:BASS family bile acid:Na+ symporter